ncbi:hypothetical protein COO60DRAFT_1477466 [Scenedesmus sp. NREL 46B-D3]|nr:hypothetical protein COO60DRAFT_1477466 [Scenedesmus sp. NREL 46B-D3]
MCVCVLGVAAAGAEVLRLVLVCWAGWLAKYYAGMLAVSRACAVGASPGTDVAVEWCRCFSSAVSCIGSCLSSCDLACAGFGRLGMLEPCSDGWLHTCSLLCAGVQPEHLTTAQTAGTASVSWWWCMSCQLVVVHEHCRGSDCAPHLGHGVARNMCSACTPCCMHSGCMAYYCCSCVYCRRAHYLHHKHLCRTILRYSDGQ